MEAALNDKHALTHVHMQKRNHILSAAENNCGLLDITQADLKVSLPIPSV